MNMDFDLTPWSDESEVFLPIVTKPRKPILTINETKQAKLPLIMPNKFDRRSAHTSNISHKEDKFQPQTKETPPSVFKITPTAFSSRLTLPTETPVKRKKLRQSLPQSLPIRHLEQLLETSIRQLKVRSTSPQPLISSSIFVKGSRPIAPSKLRPL